MESSTYFVINANCMWFGPYLHNNPRPSNPVRPIGFLKKEERICDFV